MLRLYRARVTELAKMQVQKFDINDGPICLTSPVFGDERGCFAETYHAVKTTEALGFDPVFVQDNLSRSISQNTLRGLHMQLPPKAQGKFVRCLQGKIVDVTVDARPNSPTRGQSIQVELGQDDGKALWVPPGFLHGFLTLTDDCLVAYKVTAHYSPDHDISVAWNDPDLAINWGDPCENPILSTKDQNGLSFDALMKTLRDVT